MRVVLIILAWFIGAHTLAQNITFSEEIDSFRKTVPLKIINNHPDYFCVLRYNKTAHDFTLERRRKSNSGIVSFTPLKLDSVNANWFNYENLHYECFSFGYKLFFVFEKTVNTKKTIYVKSIDSSGKSGGFKEMAFMESDQNTRSYDFIFKQSGNTLMLIGQHYYTNNTAKKTILLYDLVEEKNVWIKKLPLENEYTGFSMQYECNTRGDLFVILGAKHSGYFERRFINNQQIMVPVWLYDTLSIMTLLNQNNKVQRAGLSLSDSLRLNNIHIQTFDNEVVVTAYVASQKQHSFGDVYFFAQKFSTTLDTCKYLVKTPVQTEIKNALTFFDGSDFEEIYAKTYNLVETIATKKHLITLLERVEENYYKEMLIWKTNLNDGKVEFQLILPRKIFYFNDRIRYHNIASTTMLVCGEILYHLVLENRGNTDQNPTQFNYHRFATQRNLQGGDLIQYQISSVGALSKKKPFETHGYTYVPLKYEGTTCEAVIYFNKGKKEKFAILKPYP